MIEHLPSLLAVGLLAAGARLLVHLLFWGRPERVRGPHVKPPVTTSGIAEQGLTRIEKTDISYAHYNEMIRCQ